jgi:O-antigen/teichoic acid export membrane protein
MLSIQSKKISKNIFSSVAQVIVVGLVYLFLYKFLLKVVGVEHLGVWSIILATTSVANLANFGITSGLVKFIADYNSRNLHDKIPKLIFTSFLLIAVFFIVLISIFFLFSKLFLPYFIEPKYLSIATEILPYSLICLFINSLGGIFTSTLEGFQRNYVRNYIIVFSSIILLLASYYLVPIYKLKGVAIAQIIQAVILLIFSFISLKKIVKQKIFNRWLWDKEIFRELLNFGLKFQVISIFQMLNEPITKALISKFGGLAMLGYYEMAARLVNQIRALIVNANQVMVPVIIEKLNANKHSLFLLHFLQILF